MSADWSRRRLFLITGSMLGATTLSGCLFGLNSSPCCGTLVIRNDHSEDHTVSVTVTTTSDENDDIYHPDQTPAPETTPIWKREEQFIVEPGDRTVQEEYITEPGGFYFEARLENGERDSYSEGFYEAAGGGIAENAVFVNIKENGRMYLSASHSD